MNPELLLPAGDLDALRAAVNNGADAIYAGATSFSARKGAVNFSETQLAEAIAYAHEHSTLVYLALNTLIADSELSDALSTAVQAAACGADAIIVQDIGLAGLIHETLPDMPLHASTQMTIDDETAFPMLRQTGFHRIILPRELSLDEVARLTAAAHAEGMETEMFIHGALCVCFSGQCLFSSLMGGRSGNRGACAQPCRLSYRIQEDGRPTTASACLSPKDQAAFRHLDEIRRTGVDSLKIEGRMRSAAYVGQTAAVYRTLLDSRSTDPEALETALKRLLLVFNRGGSFTDRAFSGRKDRSFLSGPTPGSHGILLGSVADVRPSAGTLSIQIVQPEPVDRTGARKPGDPAAPSGLDTGLPGKGDFLSIRRPIDRNPAEPPDQLAEVASAPVGTIVRDGSNLVIRGFHPDALAKLRRGDQVFRMNDAAADLAILNAKNRRTAIDLLLDSTNETVRLTATVAAGPFAGISTQAELPKDNRLTVALAVARAVEQLSKTGGTPFQATAIQVPEAVLLSIASLNQLRRSVLQQLSGILAAMNRRIPPESRLKEVKDQLETSLTSSGVSSAQPASIQLAASFYQWPDADEPLACGADAYLLPAAGLERPSSLQQLADLKAAEPDALFILALPPAAAGLQAEQLRAWRNDGTLKRFDRIAGGHPGVPAIAARLGIGFEMDSTANVYNHRSLLRSIHAGAAVTCLSPELGSDQIRLLAEIAGNIAPVGHRLDWFVHGRHRLMYSAFCPVGHNVPGCRRCSGHRYALTDRRERTMPLLLHPPVCTSTILHADPIRPPENLPALITAAPARLRLLFTDESQTERANLIRKYRSQYSRTAPAQDTRTGEKGIQT